MIKNICTVFIYIAIACIAPKITKAQSNIVSQSNIDKIEYVYRPYKANAKILFSTIDKDNIQTFLNAITDVKNAPQCYCTSDYKIILYSNNKIVDEIIFIEQKNEIKNNKSSFRLNNPEKLKLWLLLNNTINVNITKP